MKRGETNGNPFQREKELKTNANNWNFVFFCVFCLFEPVGSSRSNAWNIQKAHIFLVFSGFFDLFICLFKDIFGFRFPKRRDRNQGGAGWVDIARQELDKVKKAEAIGLGLVDR